VRLTYDEQTRRLSVHAPLGERDLSLDEAEQIREAIAPLPLPWWLDAGAVVLGMVALLILARGGGA
jgi:hypothetical protein